MSRMRCVRVLSAFVGVLLCVVAAFILASRNPDIIVPREVMLRNDLYVMRSAIDQYALDKHQPPRTLNGLVSAGYIKQIPKDPMTERNDTWRVVWSHDEKMAGIDDIHSGSDRKALDGTAYSDW